MPRSLPFPVKSLAGACLLALPLSSPSLAQAHPRAGQACLTAPAEADFGSTPVGGTGTLEITVRNVCRRPVAVQTPTVTPAAFSLTAPKPLRIAGQGSAVLALRFSPADTGAQRGELRLVNNGSRSPLVIALRGSGAAASARSGDLEVSPARIDENLPSGHSVGKVFTITNHGTKAKPVYLGTWVEAPGAGGDSAGPKASILVFSTLLGDDIENNFIWLLQGLPKVSKVVVRWGGDRTPALPELLPFDMVVAIGYGRWANADSAGNLLADYVDQGGTVVLMHRALDSTAGYGMALGGRIVGPGYSPVSKGPFVADARDVMTNYFLDDPLTQSVQWFQSFTVQAASLQGKGRPLGYYWTNAIAAAYNPDLPVYYINLNPYEPDYSGHNSLAQMFLNIIDRMQGTYNWLKNPVPNYNAVFTLAPGESRRMILPVGHSYALPQGIHHGNVHIFTAWPEEIRVPATLRVR